MQPNQHNPQLVNAGDMTPPYMVLTFLGKNYRVLTHQYQSFIQMNKLWSIFWYLFTTLMLGSALILLFQQQIPFILTISQACLIIFTCYAFYKRHQIDESIFYSSLNLLIEMIPTIVLSFLGIKQLIIPLCFLVVVQILISAKFETKKSHMVAKLLVLIQALIIVLKCDEKIQTQWKNVLFINVILFMVLSICVIVITAYLVFMKLQETQANLMRQKFPGALFIYFNTIAICLITAAPLFNLFLGIEHWIILFSLSLLFAVLGTYIFLYQREIVIFFCTLNEIKAFNQIISFQSIEAIKDSKEHMFLYKMSQNWLSKNPLVGVEEDKGLNPEERNEEGENGEDTGGLTDCTICMDSAAEVVWMPCGHLTVCMQCCSEIFDKKNFNCVLCKKTPQQIYIIETSTKQHSHSPLIHQNNLQMSLMKPSVDETSTTKIVLGSQHNKIMHDKNQQCEQNRKEESNEAIVKNKLVFLVLEGYNVKII